MQIKFEWLPDDNKNETTQFLSNNELVKLAMTSKAKLALFKPLIDVRKLLHYVVRGEHDKVVAMLESDISLLYKRGLVIDCSGRSFERISAFEYALWALDKHMWTAMLECVFQHEKANEILSILRQQYDKLDSKKVTYSLNGKKTTEKHFDFENTIIKELLTQGDAMNASRDAIDKQWREGVGGAQKLLPMHVVDEYCSGEPFYPLPDFTSEPKSSKQFENWSNGKDENWFCSGSKLGVDFAIVKGRANRAWRLDCACGGGFDLDAIMELFKIRSGDFVSLRPQLDKQKAVDNQHQTFQM